jgi:hypothetical protein
MSVGGGGGGGERPVNSNSLLLKEIKIKEKTNKVKIYKK